MLTLAMCLLATAAFATGTRVLTMGDANMIVRDEANIWLFPSLLYDNPDIVIGEFGYSAFSKSMGPSKEYIDPSYIDGYNEFTDIGIHYKFGEKKPFVLGLYFTANQPNSMFPYDLAFPYLDEAYDGEFDFYGNDRLDLFYARMLGENKFGFHFGYLRESGKLTWEDTEAEESGTIGEINSTAYQFGFGLTAMQNKLDIAAEISLLSWKYQVDTIDWSEPDGNMVFSLNGRYWHEVDQKITLVPHASLNYAKVAATYDEDEIGYLAEEDKYMAVDLGIGLNYTPAAGILAIGDFGFQYIKYENNVDDSVGTEVETETEKDSYFNLPYFRVGLDAVVFDWLDLRLGALSIWYGEKWEGTWEEDDDIELTEKYGWVETYTYLGAGFHWNNLRLDAYVDPAILLDGFQFINGKTSDYYYGYDELDYADYDGMNYQVTLKYSMF